jgi:hypothetical protein
MPDLGSNAIEAARASPFSTGCSMHDAHSVPAIYPLRRTDFEQDGLSLQGTKRRATRKIATAATLVSFSLLLSGAAMAHAGSRVPAQVALGGSLERQRVSLERQILANMTTFVTYDP